MQLFSMRNVQRSGSGVLAAALIIGLVAAPIRGQSPPAPADSQWNADESGPSISLGIDGVRTATVYRGWPWLASVHLRHPQAGQPKAKLLVIGAKAGPWSKALRLTVRSASGEEAAWPFDFPSTQDAKLILDPNSGSDLQGWLSSEATAQIAEGRYHLIAVLDTTDSTVADSWKGKVSSARVTIDVRSEPKSANAELTAKKHLSFARFDLARGELEKSLAHLDSLLTKQPDHLGGLSMQADLLARRGRIKEALAICQNAINVYVKKYPNAEQPPMMLLIQQSALLKKLSEKP